MHRQDYLSPLTLERPQECSKLSNVDIVHALDWIINNQPR